MDLKRKYFPLPPIGGRYKHKRTGRVVTVIGILPDGRIQLQQPQVEGKRKAIKSQITRWIFHEHYRDEEGGPIHNHKRD